MPHNRRTGIEGEEIVLYTYFYKYQLGEQILTEPSSIGFVQIKDWQGKVITGPGSGDAASVLSIEKFYYQGEEWWGFPESSISSVVPGIKKVSFQVPYYNLDQEVKFTDEWFDAVFPDGNVTEIENYFTVAPKDYRGSDTNPQTYLDLALRVDKPELKVGEKQWLQFDVVDANNILQNIDSAHLSLSTADNEILFSHLQGIPESVSIYYYLNSVNFQSQLKQRYINADDASNYPKIPTIISKDLTNYQLNGESNLKFSVNSNNLNTYIMPSESEVIANVTTVNTESYLSIDVPKIYSSNLTNLQIDDESVTFKVKENNNDYVEYLMPKYINKDLNTVNKTEQLYQDLEEQRKNNGNINYTFSNLGSSIGIIGTPNINSLKLKYDIQPIFTTEIKNDFNVPYNSIKTFKDSTILGPSIISGNLSNYSSLFFTEEFYLDETTITSTINTYSMIISTSVGSEIKTKSTKETFTKKHHPGKITTSFITENINLSISENDGDYIDYELPYVPNGTTNKANFIASYLDSQAKAMRKLGQIHYRFSASDDSIILSSSNAVRNLKLRDIDNDCYQRIGGGFSVGEGEDQNLEYYGEINPPKIFSQSFIGGIYNSENKKSIINISENDNDYIQYQLPYGSNLSLNTVVNNLKYQREQYGVDIKYDFYLKDSSIMASGILGESKKIELKNDKPMFNVSNYLKGDFDLSEGDIKEFKIDQSLITNSSNIYHRNNIALTLANKLNAIKNDSYLNTTYSFSNISNRLTLKLNEDHSSLYFSEVAGTSLEGNFIKSALYMKSVIAHNTLIAENEPIDPELDYKWIADLEINYRRFLLETDFNFTE